MKEKSKFEQWQDNNYKKYFKYVLLGIFLVTFGIVILLTITGVYFYFTLPSTPVAVTLPANQWMLVLLGGVLSREFILGGFTVWVWFAYRKASRKQSDTTSNTTGTESKQ